MKYNDNLDRHLKFLFAIQSEASVSLEECWMEGYASAQSEFASETNPFKKGSKESEFWSEGWMAGFYGEEPLFPEYAVEIQTKSAEIAANDPNSLWDKISKNTKTWHVAVGLASIFGVSLAAIALIELAA